MIVQRYYRNTSGGHNKEYTLTYDETALKVVAEWGPIGGTKQTDTYRADTLGDLRAIVDEKHNRRMKHGYILLSTNEAGGTYAVSSKDFDADLQDLIAAERLVG